MQPEEQPRTPSWCHEGAEVIRAWQGVDETIWCFEWVEKVSAWGVTFCSGVRMGTMSMAERLYSGENKWARAMVWSFALRRRRIELSRVSTALAHSAHPANSLILQSREAVLRLTEARWEWEKSLLDLSVDISPASLVHS